MANFNGKVIRSGSPGFNPTRDVIMPISLRDPITFQATALAFAAGHLARLHGRIDTAQSVRHRVQSLQRLREHFFGVKKHSQDLDVMVAMLSLSSCEVRSEILCHVGGMEADSQRIVLVTIGRHGFICGQRPPC